MLRFIFIILALFFGYKIFQEKGVKKLPWFLAGVLFFPPAVVLIESPLIPFSKFVLYCLLGVTIKDFNWTYSYKKFPFKAAMLIIMVAYLIIGLFDERLSLFYMLYRPINNFAINFFVMFLTWYYINDFKDVKYIYGKLFVFFVFFILYGITNYLTGSNPYSTLVAEAFDTRDFANDNMVAGAERVRVSSFTWQAIYYGLLLDIIIFIEIFLLTNVKFSSAKRNIHLLFLIFLLINLLLTNSRTPIFALLLGGSIYFLLGINFKYKFFTAAIGIFFFLTAINLSENVENFVERSQETFSDEGAGYEQGSSVDMREKQLAASLIIFAQKPIQGHGFDYIQEGLGYSSEREKRESGQEFFGFESYSYKLLIEQGLVGIIANIIFALLIFIWLIKMLSQVNKIGKKAIYITMAMFVTFIAFILGTGDLGSFLFFMAVFGINIKLIMLSSKNQIMNSNYI